jgi:hypothetical protein
MDDFSVKFILSAPNRPYKHLIAENSWNLAIQNSELKDNSEYEMFAFSWRRKVP